MFREYPIRIWLRATILGAVLAAGSVTHAINFTWNGTNFNWDDPTNWDGGAGIPDGNNDTAFIAVNLDPILNSNRVIGALTIQTNGDLDLNGFQLIVQDIGGQSGTTTISGTSGSLTVRASAAFFDFDTDFLIVNSLGDLIVQTGAVAQVDQDATINSGGQVQLVNGELEVFDVLDLNDGSEIFGNGLIQITGTSNLINDGRIRASGGTLTIDATSTAGFDWDGAGSNGAEITVDTNATLNVDIPLSDTFFNGTINLNSGSVLDTAGLTYTLANSTTIDPGILNKNGAGTATVIANSVTLGGTTTLVNINAGTLVFDTNLIANSGSVIDLEGGTTVQFNGTTTIPNPLSINNIDPGDSGTSFVINGAVTIGAGSGIFEWDNQSGGDSTTTIGSNGSLTINVSSIETDAGGTGSFDGTINNSGALDVSVNQTPDEWTMDGTMNLTGGDVTSADSDTISLTGTLNANSGANNIDTFLDVDGGIVNVAAGASLFLNAASRFEPGATIDVDGTLENDLGLTFAGPNEITGTGILRNNGNWIFTDDTTISVTILDLDGTEGGISTTTINTGNTVTINSDAIETAGNEFNGTLSVNSSTLNVNTATPWVIGDAGQVTLFQGFLLPAPVLNGAEVRIDDDGELLVNAFPATINADVRIEENGTGGIEGQIRMLTANSSLNLNGLLTMAGGNIFQDNTSTVNINGDVDAIPGATNGTSTINVTTLNVSAGSTINVAAGASLQFNGVDANIAGGTHTGGGILRIVGSGVTTITGDTIIETTILDWDGLGGDLTVNPGVNFTINSDEIDDAGETFDTGTITLDGNSNLAVNTLAAWTLGNTATMNLNSGANVSGSEIIVRGAINVNSSINNVNAPVTFEATATVNVIAGDLDLEALTTYRGGTYIGAGDIFQNHDANVEANTTIATGGYVWGFGAGTITIDPGVTFTINAETNGFGGLDGTVIVENTAELAVNGPAQPRWVIDSAGEVLLQGNTVVLPQAIISGTDDIENEGTLGGNGQIQVNVVNTTGTVSPGLSAGNLVVTQNFTQGVDATLEIELGGTAAITAHDQLNVGLVATLAGTLDVSPIGGFVPSADQVFTIINAGDRIGTFDIELLPAFGGLSLVTDYLATAVNLLVVGVAGDYNYNGIVDAADYVIWRKMFGAVGEDLAADGNGDLVVDDLDYDIWTMNFGMLAGAGSGGAATAIPEPTSALLMILGGFVLTRRWR